MGSDFFKLAKDMRGNENSTAVGFCNINKNFSHNTHTVGIKTVDRLVQNQQRRFSKQSHSNTDSLLHTKRTTLEFQICIVLHANNFKNTVDFLVGVLNTEIDALHL